MKCSAIVTKRRFKSEIRNLNKDFIRQLRIQGTSIVDTLHQVSIFISKDSGKDCNFLDISSPDRTEFVVFHDLKTDELKKWINFQIPSSGDEYSVILYNEAGNEIPPNSEEITKIVKMLGICHIN